VLDISGKTWYNDTTIRTLGCAQDQRQGSTMPGWSRDCENCGDRYVATYPTQRWCCADCREEFRNAELRAARLLWRKSGKPSLDTVEHDAREEVAS